MFQYEEIVGTKRPRDIFGETLAFDSSYHLARAKMEEPLPLRIDEQEPTLRVLDVDDGRRVVEDLLQPRFAILELSLHACPLGDVPA